MPLDARVFSRSVTACIENGGKLLEDAQLLFERDRFSTAFALSILAQEEFAKAFLLQLVVDGALPWIPEVQRSMVRHQCKHLLALVMEWLPPFDWERFKAQYKLNAERHEQEMDRLQRRLERYTRGDFSSDVDDLEPEEGEFYFPPDIASALNVYRHEEIERLGSRSPRMNPDWATGKVRKIAKGAQDDKKQSGFYVDIGKTGHIGRHPGLVTREEASGAIGHAKRLSETRVTFSYEYQKLTEVLRLVFANLIRDSFF